MEQNLNKNYVHLQFDYKKLSVQNIEEIYIK